MATRLDQRTRIRRGGEVPRQAAPLSVCVDVVIVAYGEGPWLEASVDSVLASTGVDVRVFLVDNGDTSGAVERCSAPLVRRWL